MDLKCKICGGSCSIYRTKDNWHPINYFGCNDCKTQKRHWLLYENVKPKGVMLHCSPERALKEKWEPLVSRYITIDYPVRKSYISWRSMIAIADMEVNLAKTPFDNKEFDCIVLSHVMDDVKNEELAIKELHRILKDDGIIYLIVPIYKDEKSCEMENPIFNSWRRCGYDYWERYKDLFNIKLIEDEETLAIITKKI